MQLSVDDKIDWIRVIIDVTNSGHTLATISVAIDVPRTTIIGWKQGATPGFEDGMRLIELWRKVMVQQVPTVKRHSYRA